MTPDNFIFSIPMKVRDYEVDSQGIVNNAIYLHYMEHTRHEFCEMAGTTFRSLQERGIDPVLSRVEIDYKTPLHLGEEFTSCLSLAREGARFVFHQAIFNAAGRLCAQAKVSVVTIVNGHLTRGDELSEPFKEWLQ